MAGAVLPPELLEGWHPDDTGVADTVAVRSLLARGLLQLGSRGIALTRAAEAGLDPLLDARALGGLRLLGRDREERRRLVAESDTATLLLTEREPDVWTLDPLPGPVERATAWLAADLVEEGARPVPTGTTFVAPTGTLREAGRLVTADRDPAAAAALTAAGVLPAAAASWVAVLRGRLMTGEVRLTRRLRPGVFAGGTVRWLDAGPAGIWLVAPEDAPDGDPDGADSDGPLTRLTDAGAAGVRAALGALLEEDLR